MDINDNYETEIFVLYTLTVRSRIITSPLRPSFLLIFLKQIFLYILQFLRLRLLPSSWLFNTFNEMQFQNQSFIRSPFHAYKLLQIKILKILLFEKSYIL